MDACWSKVLQNLCLSLALSHNPAGSTIWHFKPSSPGDSCISLRLLSPLTDSSQESESRINVIAMSSVRVRTRCVSCWRPTFHVVSSSPVLFHLYVCVCVNVFMGGGFSADPYSGRLMPRAHEHICLSRPTEASCVLECVCSLACNWCVGKQRGLKVAVAALPLCWKKVISHYEATLAFASVGKVCVCMRECALKVVK